MFKGTIIMCGVFFNIPLLRLRYYCGNCIINVYITVIIRLTGRLIAVRLLCGVCHVTHTVARHVYDRSGRVRTRHGRSARKRCSGRARVSVKLAANHCSHGAAARDTVVSHVWRRGQRRPWLTENDDMARIVRWLSSNRPGG